MALKLKKQICDRDALVAIIDTMALNICQGDEDLQNLAMIGVLQNGAPVADRLARKIKEHTGIEVPVAYLDISLYRDDVIDTHHDPYSRRTEIPFPVKNRDILLVDDVLFTGRTTRAALSSLLSFGRPRTVRLAIVVDRGHRELPIRPDYVGLSMSTTREQGVRVRVDSPDMETGIYLYEESKS